MSALRVVGGRVLIGGELTTDDVMISGETIQALDGEPGGQVPIIDAYDLIVAPGFIDLQINGGYGHDLASDPASLWDLGRRLPAQGITGFLPTIVSAPPTTTDEAIIAFGHRPPDHLGAQPLGLHFEGPMLNPDRRGAHARINLAEPSLDLIAHWSPASGVALVTIAPELPGADDVIRALAARGIVVSAGHTEATADEAVAAIDAGVTMVTHLFNAMAPLGHRQPNLVGVALADRRLGVGLIADGQHVDPVAITATFNAKGPAGIALVTDAVAPMGLGPGRFDLGAITITADIDAVRTDDGILAGSILTMDQAVRNMVAFTGCDPIDALTMASTTPAALLGDPDRGRLTAGARADLVLLDADLNVELTICGGRVAHVADRARWRLPNNNGDGEHGSRHHR